MIDGGGNGSKPYERSSSIPKHRNTTSSGTKSPKSSNSVPDRDHAYLLVIGDLTETEVGTIGIFATRKAALRELSRYNRYTQQLDENTWCRGTGFMEIRKVEVKK